MAKCRSGWTFGDRGVWNVGPAKGDLSRYLTVLGSAHTAPVLHATREQAEAELDKRGIRNAKHMNIVVAHVTEVPYPGVSGRGYAYRINEV